MYFAALWLLHARITKYNNYCIIPVITVFRIASEDILKIREYAYMDTVGLQPNLREKVGACDTSCRAGVTGEVSMVIV